MHKVTILIFHMDNFYGDFYFYVTIYIQCVKESSMNMDLNFYICEFYRRKSVRRVWKDMKVTDMHKVIILICSYGLLL